MQINKYDAQTKPSRTDSSRRRMILYELNEVPWRVFDWYVEQRPSSALAQIIGTSACYTTRTRDEGELHPWSTWPTLHRGVYNTTHNIRFINQDLTCAAAYPPIWETLMERGVRVGVFGSLQSYPVPPTGQYCFYVPDTFAASPETHPINYSAFQSINLRQTKADGALAQSIKLNRAIALDIVRLPFVGVRPRTFALLAKQLVCEQINKSYRSRRALLQAPVAFDVFLHAFRLCKPEFCTFFTNHVAGAMHRYWKYVFPEDFGYELAGRVDKFKRETLLFAMDIADRQVSVLKAIIDRAGGELVIATSMGQKAIDRGIYLGELRLTDPNKMMAAIGFQHHWKNLLAMQPDFNFEFDSPEHASEFIRLAMLLRSPSGQALWFRSSREGSTVNMCMSRPDDVLRERSIVLQSDGERGSSRRLSLENVGISLITRDPGTGYHQPLGCLIWYGDPSRGKPSRPEIESVQVRGMILDALA